MHSSNIASHLPTIAKQQADTLAVAEQKSGRQYSFQQLDEASNVIAKGLQEIGIGKGVHTALMVTPGLDFFALVFALFKVGAVMIAIDPGIGIKQLGTCLAEAEPEAFIGIKKAHFARRLFGWAKETIKTNIIVDPGILPTMFYGQNISSLKQLKQLGTNNNKRSFLETEADDVAAILFTSGSTGSPKGVIYTHANFSAQVNALKTLYDIQPGEIDLSTFPLFALFAPAMGMSSIVPDMDFTRPGSVNPETIFSAIEKYKTTTMFGSPALLNRVGRYGEQHHKKLPNMKRVLSAGAPVPANVMKRFADMLDDSAQVFTPYGATESLPVSSIGSNEVLGSTCSATEKGKGVCVGRPVDGIELKIIKITDEPITNWQNDLILESNVIGEIAVKGPQVTKSYYARQQATELAKINDIDGGFYHRMGDTGYLDEQGRLWFCGRMTHRVITNNETLFTIPCEGIFNTHAKVFRTALVGINSNNKTIPVICVELEEEFKSDDRNLITAELLKIGQQFEQTKSIKIILFHSAFPVDTRHNAKIGREKLAVWARKK
ncbi:MAG: acyl-CoA synthetase (AMP-forming)/AMP-acid ligase II [Gammaproteobacteria bacterium]|jgi:acyl-CoA synthetase (AMP-forming)/AMP-acid ligase II